MISRKTLGVSKLEVIRSQPSERSILGRVVSSVVVGYNNTQKLNVFDEHLDPSGETSFHRVLSTTASQMQTCTELHWILLK
jgi:hypothetical protein